MKKLSGILLTALATLMFVACDDEVASAGNGSNNEQTANRVDTVYVFSKDTIYSVEKDTVYFVKKDTLYSVKKDTIYSIEKDTVYLVTNDSSGVVTKDSFSCSKEMDGISIQAYYEGSIIYLTCRDEVWLRTTLVEIEYGVCNQTIQDSVGRNIYLPRR